MKKIAVLFLLCATFTAVQAQYFSNAVETFSKKKDAMITLEDGSEVVGTIKKLDRKKGLFEEITLNTADGKVTLEAADIAFMYLPQSGLDKIGKFHESIYDATQWESEDINQDHISEGYAYFEKSECNYRKDKVETLLLQLINPAFSNKVRVYFDPMAQETASVGVGGFKVAGGEDKSYFIKEGDGVAYRMKKKEYEDHAESIFSACPDFYNAMKSDLRWTDFGEKLFNYTQECK